MPMSAEERSPEAGTGLREALRWQWWIPLLCAVSLGLAGFLLARLGDREYQAEALLQVNNANLAAEVVGVGAGTSFKPIQNVLTELPPRVHQRSIARRAAQALEPELSLTPKQVLEDTSVSVDEQTGLVPVTATASRPRDAARIANALAHEYVDLRQSRDLDLVRQARIDLERIAAERARDSRGDPAALSDLDSLNDRIAQLRLTEALRPASVALSRPATPPSSPSGAAPELVGIAGGILGLLIGLGIVALRAGADGRVLSVRNLEIAMQAPILTRIPSTVALGNRWPVADLAPREAEPFRLLLAVLRHAPDAATAQSVAITSGANLEGKSTTAWYLAATAAASGTRTLLLDANDARPSALVSDSNGAPGGLSALLGGAGLGEVVTPVEVVEGRRLDLIAPGAQDGTAHLASPDIVARALERLQAEYEFIVVETPPLLLAANAVPFVRAADGVVAVCRNGIADRERAEELREAIESLQAHLFGIAAVGFAPASVIDERS